MTYEQLKVWREEDSARDILAMAWGVLVSCRISERRGHRTAVGYSSHIDERVAIKEALTMLEKSRAAMSADIVGAVA